MSQLAASGIRVRLIVLLPCSHPSYDYWSCAAQCDVRCKYPDRCACGVVRSPTCLYDSYTMSSATVQSQLHTLKHLVAEVPSFADANALLRQWASQRGYWDCGDDNQYCVLGFADKSPWWIALLSFTVYGGQILSGTSIRHHPPLGCGPSSYQLFRAALSFLGAANRLCSDVFP